MTPTITRKDLLRRVAGGAAAGAAATAALPSKAQAQTTLGARFICPYPPRPVIAYPRSWFLYAAEVPNAGAPYAVVVSSSEFVPLPSPGAEPDLRAAASDLTMVLLNVRESARISSISSPGVSPAIALDGRTMRFEDLAAATTDRRGFRRLSRWYVATSGDARYGMQVMVDVGPDADAEWQHVRAIVDSIHMA